MGVLDIIRDKLSGKKVDSEKAANAAADTLGGGAGNAVKAIRGRQAQLDAQLDAAVGMPPPRREEK